MYCQWRVGRLSRAAGLATGRILPTVRLHSGPRFVICEPAMKSFIAFSAALIMLGGVRAQDASKSAAKGPIAEAAKMTEKSVAEVAAQLKDKDAKTRRAAG